MFSHPTEDYDFVIHLHPTVVTRYTQSLSADRAVWGGAGKKYANLGRDMAPSVFGETIRLDFDPVHLFYLDLQVRLSVVSKLFAGFIDHIPTVPLPSEHMVILSFYSTIL